jgi:short-subunit dehydrogenase
MQLKGKVVLITGASGGIGAACAAAFRARGAHIAGIARSADKLAAAVGPEGLAIPGDITDPMLRRIAIERTLERFGRIDVLVNNAGRGFYCPTAKASLCEAQQLFALNFFAPLEMMQLVIPGMHAQGEGMIVNIGSIAGRVPLPWLAIYSASKYAIGALTDAVRMELKGTGIHTMTVCLGYVKTGFQDNAMGGDPPDRVVSARTFAITAEHCAGDIVRGVERNARTVVTPRAGWIFIAFERMLPWVIDARMAAINRRIWTSD